MSPAYSAMLQIGCQGFRQSDWRTFGGGQESEVSGRGSVVRGSAMVIGGPSAGVVRRRGGLELKQRAK